MAKIMSTAHAIIVLPTVIKGGFLIAAEGGGGVLTVRRGDGSWSNPAFYTLASASIGLQAGLQLVSTFPVAMHSTGPIHADEFLASCPLSLFSFHGIPY